MHLVHLFLLSLALYSTMAVHHIPLKAHKPTKEQFEMTTASLKKLAETTDSIPWKFGRIPLSQFSRDELGFIPLTNWLNTQFFGEIDVGTPGQTITTMFDTGSTNMFVLAPSCTGLACYNRTYYNYMTSKSFFLNGTLINLNLGGGNFSGFIGEDLVAISDMKVRDMVFALIDHPDSINFLYSRFDALIGFGYADLAVDEIPPLFQFMLDQGVISEPSFSFYFTKDYNETGSAMVLGGISDRYNWSDFHYVNLTHKTYYMTDLDDFKLGNKSFISKKMNLIVDSGTSVIVGPNELIDSILPYFPTRISCDRVSSYEDIYFTIGGVDYVIPPTIYIIENFGHCALGVVGADFDEALQNTIILGEVFMRAYYTHFDYGNARLGFALSANLTKTENEGDHVTIEI